MYNVYIHVYVHVYIRVYTYVYICERLENRTREKERERGRYIREEACARPESGRKANRKVDGRVTRSNPADILFANAE